MTQRKVIVRGATNQALDELDATDIPDLSGAYDAAGAAVAAQNASQPLDPFLTDLSVYANFAALVDALKPYFLEPD